MVVKCIENVVDESTAAKINIGKSGLRHYRSITLGNEYSVLGIHFPVNSNVFGLSAAVHLRNDQGSLSIVPMVLLEVTDPTPSIYWQFRSDNLGRISIFPSAFFAEYFHDDLSEGVNIEEFQQVCLLIDQENHDRGNIGNHP